MTQSSTSGTLSSVVYTLQQSNPRHVSPCCLVKVQRGCVWGMCVCPWLIIASREAAGTLLRREPMTLKSCAPRLPNNRPNA